MQEKLATSELAWTRQGQAWFPGGNGLCFPPNLEVNGGQGPHQK